MRRDRTRRAFPRANLRLDAPAAAATTSASTAAPAASSPAVNAVPADLELDCRGLLCPLPVYRASQALAHLAPGQALRVTCTDPGSLADFPALARQRGLTLLSAEEQGGVQVFRLRKGAA